MSGHFREECEHGVVITQCRCPGPSTAIGPCPEWCPYYNDQPESNEELDSNALTTLAEHIVLSHTEDIEFLSVWEMMDDRFRDNEAYKKLTDRQQHELALRVDNIIRSAIVTVTFPKETN